MTALTHASAGRAGIKGLSTSFALSGVDMFAGPNGSAKSAHLLIVGVGVRGLACVESDSTREYLGPDLPAATTTLTFDVDGAEVKLHRDHSQSSRTKAFGLSDAQADEIVGAHVVRFDLADFVAGGTKGRQTVLDGVLQVAGASEMWTPTKIVDHVSRELSKVSEWNLQNPEDDEPQTDEQRNGADHPWLVLRAAHSLHSTDLPAWFATASSWYKGVYTTANAAQKQASAAADTAATEAEREAPAGSLRTARARVVKLEQDQAGVLAALATAKLRKDHTVAREAREAELVEQVGRCTAAKEQGEAALAKARDIASDLRTQGEPLLTATASAVSAATAARSALDAAVAASAAARDAQMTAATDAATVNAEVAVLEGLVSGLGGGSCLQCGAADPLGIGAKLSVAKGNQDDAGDALMDASTALLMADAHVNRARTARDDARKAHNAAQGASDTNAADLQRANKAVVDATERSGGAASALRMAEQALTSHQQAAGATDDADLSGDHDTMVARRDALAAELGNSARPEQGSARWDVEQHLAHNRRQAALQETIAARDAAVERFATVKKLGVILKETSAKIATDAYLPVCSAAQEMLDECGAGLLAVIRSEDDFGAIVDPKSWPAKHVAAAAKKTGALYVSWWSLSRSQRAILGVALATAFARLSGSMWRTVVIDDIEHIDDDHRGAVINGLAAMKMDARLDNVLLGMVAKERPDLGDDVQVHWLGDADGAA